MRTGSTIRGSGGKVIQVSKISRHPNFDFAIFDYDIVILELTEDIEISETSQIIALADSEPAPGSNALASGWGRMAVSLILCFFTIKSITVCHFFQLDQEESEILQSVVLPIVDRVKCNRSYSIISQPIPVNDLKICAGGKDSGMCKGDSGGPLVIDGIDGKKVLVGATSFAEKHGCATYGYPGGFTNVANPEIRQFILEHAGV